MLTLVSGLVAAADPEEIGGMIALVPSEQDRARLSLDGGTPAERLHVTLWVLGHERSPELAESLATYASEIPPIQAGAWAAAVFNPTDSEREPALVLLVGDHDEGWMEQVREVTGDKVAKIHASTPQQHAPWVPHVTLEHGTELSHTVEDVTDRVGPVTLDRLVLVEGDDWTYFDLTGEDSEGDRPDDADDPEAVDDDPSVAPSTPATLTAAAVPPHSTPTLPREADWDGSVAEKALPTGESPSFYARFYAYMAPTSRRSDQPQDGTAKDHWHYLHHVVEGSGSDAVVGAASVEACTAVVQLLNGARGVDLLVSGDDRRGVYEHVARHLRDAGEDPPELLSEQSVRASVVTLPPSPPPPDCDDFLARESITADASTSIIPTVPAAHFDPPDLSSPTPLTVTDDGHVYGHVALSSICHVGYPECITMPRTASALRYFHTGVVRLDDGTDLPTGRITVKGGHAPIDMGWREAVAHYDDVTTAAADVVAWEDDHGIAVTGHVRDSASPELVHALRASAPSGDWRRIGTTAELIAIHAVNTPGFPVYRIENETVMASVVPVVIPRPGDGDPSSPSPSPSPHPHPHPHLDPSDLSSFVSAHVVAHLEGEEVAGAISGSLEDYARRLRERTIS